MLVSLETPDPSAKGEGGVRPSEPGSVSGQSLGLGSLVSGWMRSTRTLLGNVDAVMACGGLCPPACPCLVLCGQ